MSTGELETRPGRDETQPRHAPTPKKRTRGLAPSIFCEVDAPKTCVNMFVDNRTLLTFTHNIS